MKSVDCGGKRVNDFHNLVVLLFERRQHLYSHLLQSWAAHSKYSFLTWSLFKFPVCVLARLCLHKLFCIPLWYRITVWTLSCVSVNPHLRITAQTRGWWSGPGVGTVPGAGGPGRRGNACAGYWQRLGGTGFVTAGGSGRLISVSVWALVLRKRVVACSATVREADTNVGVKSCNNNSPFG